MDSDPLATRACGACTACCTVMTIDEPELQKLPGHTCTHCTVGQGCAIHATRPEICRVWFCGWRQLDWVAETLRPDLSGVIIYLTEQDIPEECGAEIGLVFSIMTDDGLAAPGLPEALATAIHGGIPSFVNAHGRPGHAGVRLLVNDLLKEAIAAGSKADLLRDLNQVYRGLRFATGAGGPDPITLTEYDPDPDKDD